MSELPTLLCWATQIMWDEVQRRLHIDAAMVGGATKTYCTTDAACVYGNTSLKVWN